MARFKARYGARAKLDENGDPRTSDPLWSAWRREQVTQFLRRLYLSATAIKPSLNVSAALICYGAGPGKSFESSEAYWHVFQDWAAWAREGIAIAMSRANGPEESEKPKKKEKDKDRRDKPGGSPENKDTPTPNE